ncbi:multiple epidermal growth factor-like domains protein 11, partial [Biomphalaria pfeifferi]
FCNTKDTVSCKYKCLCNGSCSNDGNCERSFCSKGWFGIACQYSDVASDAIIQPKGAETLLANSSRQDCGQRSGPQYVLLTWSEPLPFTWLRIKIVSQTFFTNISLKLNDVLCQKTKIYSVDDTTLDIACDTNISMTALKLEGDIIENICTLFVSGGRNLAIFQNSSESSTFGSPYYGPQFAVDGIINPSCLNGGCSHTNETDRSPKWTVDFGQQYNINKCVLYNRIHRERNRTDNFILEMLDNKNIIKFHYKNTEPTKLIYTVLVKNDGYFAARVRQNDTFPPQEVTYLCLNEFEAYGECPLGFWGIRCTEKCQSPCSSSCHAEHGKCNTKCIGYKDPPECSDVCDSKYYGQNCSNICSTSCVDQACDRYDGHCLHCNKTMYGRQCLEKCSSRCLNDSCDVSTGKCLACKPDYVGDFCDTNPMDVSVAVGVAVGAATVVVLLIIAGIVAYKKRVQQTKLKSNAGIDNVVKSQENDHYESIQNKDRNDSISIHDHYDIVSSESNWKQKENERQYETVSSENPYDKLSSDVDETSNAQYEKVSSPNRYENVSRQKQLEHFSIEDK